MAEIELFTYDKGCSRLHKTHPTLKIIILSVISISITYGSNFYLVYYLLLLLLGFYTSGIKKVFNELKYILFISLSLLLFQLLLKGDFSIEAILTIGIYILRIFLIILMGRLFTGTTRPEDITPGLFNILRNKKLTENISLTIRLVPTFFIGWAEINETLNSRGLYMRKNPIYILKNISIPLLIETFKNADIISQAMESRCYTGWVKTEATETKIDFLIIFLVTIPHLQLIKMLLPLGL